MLSWPMPPWMPGMITNLLTSSCPAWASLASSPTTEGGNRLQSDVMSTLHLSESSNTRTDTTVTMQRMKPSSTSHRRNAEPVRLPLKANAGRCTKSRSPMTLGGTMLPQDAVRSGNSYTNDGPPWNK
jgi:hypothetical protein